MWKSIRDVVSSWWLLLILGILAVIAGILLFTDPMAAAAMVAVIVAVNFLVTGIMRLVFVLSNKDSIPGWGWNLLACILMIIMGVCLVAVPGLKAQYIWLLYSIGLLSAGVAGVINAFAVAKVEGSHWVLSLIFALLTIVVGIGLILHPLVALGSIGLLAGIAMVSNGISMIIASIGMSKTNSAMKRVEKDVEQIRKDVQDYASQK